MVKPTNPSLAVGLRDKNYPHKGKALYNFLATMGTSFKCFQLCLILLIHAKPSKNAPIAKAYLVDKKASKKINNGEGRKRNPDQQ
jgi:hypothetical protein